MSIVEKLKGIAGDWVLKVATKRIAAGVTGSIIGLVTSEKVAGILTSHGVTLDPQQLEAGLIASVTAGVIALHDWLRLRKGFEWL